jgi:pimeloyl-ACP methyl ester carboxylesterase
MELFSSQVTIPLGWQAFQEMAFSPQTRQTLVERSMALLREVRPGVLLCDWRACYGFDIRNQVPQINAPGWIATGADDRLTPLSFARFLSTQLPEARLQVVPSAGHMAIQEQPQELASGLRSFLEELEPSLDRYMQA